jgi:hypothetical protein
MLRVSNLDSLPSTSAVSGDRRLRGVTLADNRQNATLPSSHVHKGHRGAAVDAGCYRACYARELIQAGGASGWGSLIRPFERILF